MRKAILNRQTSETKIKIELNLDGDGSFKNTTGIGFFDHMLDQLSKHSLINLKLECKGDLHIDDHHTVEDVGICLGKAILKALNNKIGIKRYGSTLLTMDDALIQTSLDISGRPSLHWSVDFKSKKIGNFDVSLVQEFFNALCINSGINLHVIKISGTNDHHIAEAIFKSFAKSIRTAVEIDEKTKNIIPSTKGVL